jgi:hypothetical protein
VGLLSVRITVPLLRSLRRSSAFLRGRNKGTQLICFGGIKSCIPLFHPAHFAEFEKAFGKKSDGTSKPTDQGAEGRFRCYDRAVIGERGDNLDISWLKDDDATGADELPAPDEIALLIRERLSTALKEMDALVGILQGNDIDRENDR